MSKIAKDAFAKQNYRLAVEILERCLFESNDSNEAVDAAACLSASTQINQNSGTSNDISVDLYFWYGDSLARCGRLNEAFDVYGYIANRLTDRIPLERLSTLSGSLIDYIRAISKSKATKVHQLKNAETTASSLKGEKLAANIDPLLCPICQDVISCPVTTVCGHTFCRECCESVHTCHLCNVKLSSSPTPQGSSFFSGLSSATNSSSFGRSRDDHLSFGTDVVSNLNPGKSTKYMPDILVRRLVEKWWGKDLQAKEWNASAAQCMDMNLLDEALKFCNESLKKSPNNFRSLLLRSEVLCRLSHYQSSLADVDNALKINSKSSKAHYQRAQSLVGLGKIEEAFTAQCIAVSLDTSTRLVSSSAFKKDLAKIIQRVLGLALKRTSSRTPCAPYTIISNARRKRKLYAALSRGPEKFLPTLDYGQSNYDVDNQNLLQHGSRKHCRRKSSVTTEPVACPTQTSIKIRTLLDRMHAEVQTVQKTDKSEIPQLLEVDPGLIDASDFDCVLCCRTLWKPVVTPCGHTYCWVCLDRCMDYSSSCPLCMSPLIESHSNLFNQGASSPVPLVLAKRPTTKFLETAMIRFIPDCYEKRFIQEMESEPSVPVFICTTAFPHVPCPLFVYEPRYRLMVRRAIESGERQFGIVQPQSGKSRHSDVGTMLDIRDCVLLGDGCSILSTIGCRRFRILTRNEKDGYETAKVEYIYDETISEDNAGLVSCMHDTVLHKAILWFENLSTELKEEILRSFGPMPALEDNWESIGDGPAWAWWIIAILPLNQQLKVNILATTSLEKRLRAIEKTLDFMSGTYRRSQESCVVVQCEGLQACPTVECCQRTSSAISDPNEQSPTPPTRREHSELML